MREKTGHAIQDSDDSGNGSSKSEDTTHSVIVQQMVQ